MSVLNPQFVQALSDRYRLDREIGQGGMATVYLAHDIRHDRQVAVKILRPELAAIIGGERFLHEIRTTANLQHPHILPLHDSGEVAGSVFYVMPFVEGQSLRDRLQHEKQLPVDEAVRITREVASALDYAHRHGVVHRDIKPENILLHDGQALVADFGIALAVSRSDGGSRMTETGMSLGTPHYMAPEQAMGEREISPRADVYALGCVLYECLVGEPPFTGPTAQAIIARVMTDQPRALQTQRRTIPPHVEAATRTALEKLPADRFASAAAFSEALGNPAYGAGTAAMAAAAHPGAAASWDPRTWSVPTRVLAAAALVFGATTLWPLLRGAPERAPTPVIAFTAIDSVQGQPTVAVSVHGAIAWISDAGIRLRRPGEVTASVVPGTDGADGSTLSFSPDGEWLAYVTHAGARAAGSKGSVMKISLAGGGPQPVTTDLPGATFEFTVNGIWADDGALYLSIANTVQRSAVITRVDAGGGPLDTVVVLRGVYATVDALLPGGRTILLTIGDAAGTDFRIVAVDLRRADTTSVALAYSARWSPTGHLLFVRRDGTMQATPFDPRGVEATGPAITVMDSIVVAGWLAAHWLAPTGTLVYLRGASEGQFVGVNRLAFVGSDGRIDRPPLPATDHPDGAISPDGRRVAYTRGDQIWIYDLDLGSHRQLTSGGSAYHNPLWSPDGARILYRATRDTGGAGAMYVQPAEGGGAPVMLAGTAGTTNPGAWLSDGTLLSYTDGAGADIFRSHVDSGGLTPLLNADWAERAPRVSPDGRWIAYHAAEGGPMRLYVRRWPNLRDKVQVSEGVVRALTQPLWSADSRTLHYQEGTRLIAATVAAGETFRIASRRVVSDSIRGPLVGVHPDGRLFGFIADQPTGPAGSARRRLIVIANWHEQLRARMRTAR